MMDPAKTMCVVMHEGKEVGRVAANAENASDYIQGLVSHYGNVSVDYVPDENAWLSAALSGGPRRAN